MLEDEDTSCDVVAGDAGEIAQPVSYSVSGRDGKCRCSRGISYQPRKRTLEPAGCLRSSCRKMCLLGSGPCVIPLILCSQRCHVMLLIFE